MNISNVRKQISGASYEPQVEILENIYEKAGNCVMNGYLGSAVTNISYDENGLVEFQSQHMVADLITESTGAVLRDSVIIKQVQKKSEIEAAQLFSWKKDGSSYTYIGFTDINSMNFAYNQIKQFYPHYLDGNFAPDFEYLNIPLDSVLSVKCGQKPIRKDTALSLVDDAVAISNSVEQLEPPLML